MTEQDPVNPAEQVVRQDRLIKQFQTLLDRIEQAQGGPDDLSAVREAAPSPRAPPAPGDGSGSSGN